MQQGYRISRPGQRTAEGGSEHQFCAPQPPAHSPAAPTVTLTAPHARPPAQRLLRRPSTPRTCALLPAQLPPAAQVQDASCCRLVQRRAVHCLAVAAPAAVGRRGSQARSASVLQPVRSSA